MSDFKNELYQEITEAAEIIGRTWPLYSFVTSNPLSGFENKPFGEAAAIARGLLGGRGYPTASQFRQAWDNNSINPDILNSKLKERNINESIEELLYSLEERESAQDHRRSLGSAERSLNQILEKWLSSFLDEGRSRWSMPNREKGFYKAWKEIATVDRHIPDSGQLQNLPENKHEAIEHILEEVPPKDRNQVFTYHLATLPGWVGYIKQRSQRKNNEWAEEYPIDLSDYLAVRLILADHLNATIVPEKNILEPERDELDNYRKCLLEAWEETYRQDTVDALNLEQEEPPENNDEHRPEAQLVFCIDTRSEVIRRHIESTGDYETHGYAGFFGIPMRYGKYGEPTFIDACPPIVEPEHSIQDKLDRDQREKAETFESWAELKKETRKSLKDIKDNIASAFNYVEFSGFFYGLGMIGKTLLPSVTQSALKASSNGVPEYYEVTEPQLKGSTPKSANTETDEISLQDKVQYAENAFKLMGWENFARLVIFVGHTSQTSNNPFDSSLQCGACSGNSGAPSARVLAQICNDDTVQQKLMERGYDIPEDTLFLAGRHNTTTDEIQLFDHDIPVEYAQEIKDLSSDLETARRESTAERMNEMPGTQSDISLSETERRANDWAQTRPEWGLAGNASFIVGPNRIRQGVDLDGRSFLHTYDWKTDPDGSALESIFTGPVVVCQWINHQYYFSSIDNGLYGSGSKITHNPVGNFGVLQGNGGDLMGGLPLQSLMKSDSEIQHEPLRIHTLVHAPTERVRAILEKHESIDRLVSNNWIGLEVIDPEQNNKRIRFSDKGSIKESHVKK